MQNQLHLKELLGLESVDFSHEIFTRDLYSFI